MDILFNVLISGFSQGLYVYCSSLPKNSTKTNKAQQEHVTNRKSSIKDTVFPSYHRNL